LNVFKLIISRESWDTMVSFRS